MMHHVLEIALVIALFVVMTIIFVCFAEMYKRLEGEL